jgi:hypothetical protein
VEVRLPGDIYPEAFDRATLFSYDADPVEIEMTRGPEGAITLLLPEQRLWSVIELA